MSLWVFTVDTVPALVPRGVLSEFCSQPTSTLRTFPLQLVTSSPIPYPISSTYVGISSLQGVWLNGWEHGLLSYRDLGSNGTYATSDCVTLVKPLTPSWTAFSSVKQGQRK